MASFHHNKLYWRITVLILCGIAFLGPWWFESMLRMGGDCSSGFPVDREVCALPVSGLFVVLVGVGFVFHLVSGPFAMSTGFATWFPGLMQSLLCLLPLLPFPVTLVIMRLQENDERRGQLVQVVVWGMAVVGASLFSRLFVTVGPRWALWGFWLYITLALAMLLLETLELLGGRHVVTE
jgi:hypothetical protein